MPTTYPMRPMRWDIISGPPTCRCGRLDRQNRARAIYRRSAYRYTLRNWERYCQACR